MHIVYFDEYWMILNFAQSEKRFGSTVCFSYDDLKEKKFSILTGWEQSAMWFEGNIVQEKSNMVICTSLPLLSTTYYLVWHCVTFFIYYSLLIAWFLVQFGKTCTREFCKELKCLIVVTTIIHVCFLKIALVTILLPILIMDALLPAFLRV